MVEKANAPEFRQILENISQMLSELQEDVRVLKLGIKESTHKLEIMETANKKAKKQFDRQEKEAKQWHSELNRRLVLIENNQSGKVALSGGYFNGPAAVQYSPSGSGLIDPEWRWGREHPYRSR